MLCGEKKRWPLIIDSVKLEGFFFCFCSVVKNVMVAFIRMKTMERSLYNE